MKKQWYRGVEFYVIGPIVIGLIVVALWLSVSAAYENYRLARASDQIVDAVILSRELRLTPDDTPARAMNDFFKRYAEYDSSDIEIITPSSPGKEAERGLLNPWGGTLRFFFYPSLKAVRLETTVSSVACRRLLLFYAKDVAPMGIRRIDVKADNSLSVWRLVYDEPKDPAQRVLDARAIQSGCGNDPQNLLSLTFNL